MPLTERQAIIQQLQEIRGSKVIVYFLSDRRIVGGIPASGMNTVLASEAYPFFCEHVRRMGKVQKLDLLLHTRGGSVDSVWQLVRLLRQTCDRFSVIVPMRAESAGTLICLGADEVVMSLAANLSPIDPSTANAFNPKDQGKGTAPISVEDVTAYFDLARAEQGSVENPGRGSLGLKTEEALTEVFKILSQRVHPLALGNVKRVHSQIRAIAKRLLQLHIKGEDPEERINRIVSTLTELLYSHGHAINREEASDILGADKVAVPSAAEDEAIWKLFEQYQVLFDLRRPFCIKEWMGSAVEKELIASGAVIESEGHAHVFKAMTQVRRMSELPQGVQIQIPPGQRMPLIPGLPTMISMEPIWEGWYSNEEGV